jgi:hypothetical protein
MVDEMSVAAGGVGMGGGAGGGPPAWSVEQTACKRVIIEH